MSTNTRDLVQRLRYALSRISTSCDPDDWAGDERMLDVTAEAMWAADKWLASPPTNQCGETCERASLCAVCRSGLEGAAAQAPAWRVIDGGSPVFLDGIEAQYSIEDAAGRVVAYAFRGHDADTIAGSSCTEQRMTDSEIADLWPTTFHMPARQRAKLMRFARAVEESRATAWGVVMEDAESVEAAQGAGGGG